jgi:class 3 adenylate cyclase
MLSQNQLDNLKKIALKSLQRAEELWDNTLGNIRQVIAEKMDSETNIPGHPYLKDNDYVSDTFIAMMIDLRDSTKHLRQAIRAKASQMERVFYEVSALLPTMAKIIQDENGAITEYLGDGAIALFQFPQKKCKEQQDIIYAVSRTAQNCIHAVKDVINPILSDKYQLPELQIGIGLAFSDAIITRFGYKPHTQIKVIGECIYFASKLSKGRNEIFVHEWLENAWPIGDNPKVRFKKMSKDDVNGYLLERI